MQIQPQRRQIVEGSELAQLLDEIDELPVILEKDGELYRLTKETDIWAGYDPERVRQALRKSAGALRDVNRTELLTEIHAAREQDSQGRPAA